MIMFQQVKKMSNIDKPNLIIELIKNYDNTREIIIKNALILKKCCFF